MLRIESLRRHVHARLREKATGTSHFGGESAVLMRSMCMFSYTTLALTRRGREDSRRETSPIDAFYEALKGKASLS